MLWGIDRLVVGELGNTRRRLRTSKIGVLSQASAVDRRGVPSVEALQELGIRPLTVFSPEHGFDGSAQAEESIVLSHRASGQADRREDPDADEPDGEPLAADSTPPRPISLYGEDKASLQPTAEMLDGLDVLAVDLADVGSRYYTYVWTALLSARAAADAGVHTLVLDRPNPISGDPAVIEGMPQQDGFTSFVGLEKLPIRHSLTLAEILVHFFSEDGKALGPDGALSVISTRGWERHRTAKSWERPFVPPSPNMPSAETALVYPGGCLIEGTNLSEGRGTTIPFQCVGAPFLDAAALTRALRDAQLPGVIARPHSFRPSFEKHAGELCHGVCLHVTRPALFRPVTTYLTLIALARAQAPEAFRFRTEPYEFEDTPAFDLLTGSSQARLALLDGASPEAVVELVAPVEPSWREMIERTELLALDAHA